MKKIYVYLIFIIGLRCFGQPGSILSSINYTGLNSSVFDANPSTVSRGLGIGYLSDIDGDGNRDLAITSHISSSSENVVNILFLDKDKNILKRTVIGRNMGGLTKDLPVDMKGMGHCIVDLGDLDKDGVPDIAISNVNYDLTSKGEFFIVFLNSDGTVKDSKTITSQKHGFNRGLNSQDHFGSSIENIGDLNNDGNPELLVGAPGNDFDKNNSGVAFVLYLNSDGTVLKHTMISAASTGFTKPVTVAGSFSFDVAYIGVSNSITTVAFSAMYDSTDGRQVGAIYLMKIDSQSNILDWKKIAPGMNGFTDTLNYDGFFGYSIAGIQDIDGDGNHDLLVGFPRLRDGNVYGIGGAYILFLNNDLTVKSHTLITNGTPNFNFSLQGGGNFGTSVEFVGDWNSDGKYDIAVGGVRYNNTNVGITGILLLDGADHTGLRGTENRRFDVYPNPTDNYIYVKSLPDEEGKIEVYSSSGVKVLGYIQPKFQTDYNFDVSSLSPGVYFIQYQSEDSVLRKKIIIN